MAVLLKNLLARSPKMEDLVAITELVRACDVDEYGLVDSTMEDLAFYWHQPGFNLATDAWIIVTNKGQVVGFTCVWHRDYEQIFTFVGVHPEYRGRGIASSLIATACADLRRRKFTALTLTVTQANANAVELYKKLGFSVTRVFDAFVWEG